MNAKPPRTLDSEEQLKLLEALRSDDAPSKTRLKGIRNYLMACLMLDAGLRVGEVVQLEVSHLWFAGKPVRSLVLTKSITKNHKERTVPVNGRLAEAIYEFFSDVLRYVDYYPSLHVFKAPQSNKFMTTRQVENNINKAAAKSLGRLVNPHMLRHTFGSSLLRVTNLRTVQELLGHNYVTSTQIYTHVNEDDKHRAITDLEKENLLIGDDL